MRAKKGRLRLSPNEEAQLIKDETEKRRKMRIQQVREQCKENAAKVRHAVKREKHKQLMQLANDLKGQLEEEKEERVRHLEQQYENSLRSIGVGHKHAGEQPDWSEERELLMKAENLRAEARGQEALERLRQETAILNERANRHIKARKLALTQEKVRAAEVAAMPPPPPDPLDALYKDRQTVKVQDMNAFSTTHYHMVNEEAVDRADPDQQSNAKEAAEVEEERIRERALELKRLRQDQLERARVRHNAALEKELLKHDYDNILHDLSDLQRDDRERRLRIVHNIPKQVFEPPSVRMEDREDKQKQMEQDFEDMYMAGTDYMGDVSMALDPQPRPLTPTGTDSLDVTGTPDGTPLQHPTLPAVPPVLRDLTNVPVPNAPGKKQEKVLRKLMDRIKTQREEWMTSHSLLEVGEGERRSLVQGEDSGLTDTGKFQTLQPDTESVGSAIHSPPEKLPRVHSPADGLLPADGSGQPPLPMDSVGPTQQTNVQLQPPVTEKPLAAPTGPAQQEGSEQQQRELQDILQQQEYILQQKQQLEEKLKQLNSQHQELQGTTRPQPTETQPPGPTQAAPDPVLLLPSSVPVNQFASSMSSSGMSTQPMNSIPPSVTTTTGPMTTMPQMQQANFQPYQPPVGVPMSTGAQPLPGGAVPTGSSLPMVTGGPGIPATAEAHNEQLRRVKEYQQYLLARHEQSKKVLDETKAEIKRRRENLLERYPKLDLSRLEILGARYLESVAEPSVVQPQGGGTAAPPPASTSAAPPPASTSAVPVSSLLASLASHPYYASSLNQPVVEKVTMTTTSAAPPSTWTVGTVQANSLQPDLSLGGPQTKGKFDGIRKSLPFDADDTLQSPAVRVYEAYSTRPHDITLDTSTEAEVTVLSDSPMPKPQSRKHPMTSEESDMDSSASTSFMSDRPDPAHSRQEELRQQLADIQRQKEEIIQLHRAGQQHLQMKQDLLKAKLATAASDGARQDDRGQSAVSAPPASLAGLTSGYSTSLSSALTNGLSADDNTWRQVNRDHNLSTILEVDTPRISDGGTGRLSTSSSEGGVSSLHSRRSLDYPRAQTISEEPSLEDVETQVQFESSSLPPVQRQQPSTAAGYSNVEDILQRAKQFETEVLEKLRRQTNSVFDQIQELEESGEVPSPQQLRPGTSLSSGSLTESFSTGPLDESSVSRSKELLEGRSGNGSFQSNKSWAAELASYKTRPQSDGSFRVLQPDPDRPSTDSSRQSSMFAGDVNRFQIYSSIASRDKPVHDTSKADSSLGSALEESGVTAADMLQHLRDLQQELKTGEETRRKLERELAERQAADSMKLSTAASQKPQQHQTADLSQYSIDNRDLTANQSGVPPTHRSVEADSSKTGDSRYQEGESRKMGERSSQAADYRNTEGRPAREADTRKSAERGTQQFPVRRSPIGDLLNTDTQVQFGTRPPLTADGTQSEYSFMVTDDKNRVTSTPGEARNKSTLNDQSTAPPTSFINQSELPSEIIRRAENDSLLGRLTDVQDRGTPSTGAAKSAEGRDLSTYSLAMDGNRSVGGHRLSPVARSHTETPPADLTTYSMSSQEDSARPETVQTHRLSPVASRRGPAPGPSVQTYALSKEGDLVPEAGAQHRLSPVAKRHTGKKGTDLSTFSVSSQGNSTQGPSNLTSYSVSSQDDTNRDTKQFFDFSKNKTSSNNNVPNQFRHKKDGVQDSTNVRSTSSTSFTSVTPTEPSLNLTGGSSLSQYTMKSNDTLQFTQRTEPSNASSMEPDKAETVVQERFASLDQLISESKAIIAKHKVIIGKNKQLEDAPPALPKSPIPSLPARETTLATAPGKKAPPPPPPPKPKSWLSSPKQTGSDLSGSEADFSRLSSFHTANKSNNASSQLSGYQASRSQNKSSDQSGTTDTSSMEYLLEHSSGIMEEPIPDFSTMGSELSVASISRVDISDSEDSLKSFEKHELTETESLSNSQVFDEDGSLMSRSGDGREVFRSPQENFAQKRQQFLDQSEQRMKERAQNREDGHQVFRAVPVAVVAEPTLSMSVKVSAAEGQRGRSPTPVEIKRTQSVKDARNSFEAKEQEIKASMSPTVPLNRTLQPRGVSPPRQKDSGSQPPQTATSPRSKDGSSHPKDGGTHPRESSIPVPISPVGSVRANPVGALAGEIRSFGGSAGFSARKTPPKTHPKPKPQIPALKPKTAKAAPPTANKPAGGLGRTLSSWKKSRSLKANAPPEPVQSKEMPRNSIKVLPQEAPEPMTDEERQKKLDREVYERNMRAYNPRLFRLAHRLDNDDDDDKATSEDSMRSSSERQKDGKKKSQEKRKKAKVKK